jgi:membrane protein
VAETLHVRGTTTMRRVRDGVQFWSKRPLFDFARRFVERDREIDADVLGSAVALRVFLFFVPLLLTLVGLAGFLSGVLSSDDAADELGVSGTLAELIDTALRQSSTGRLVALVTGMFGAAWAGRTLAKVLAAASRRAWRLADRPRSSLRIVGAIAGLVGVLGLLATLVNRVRSAAGLTVATTALLGAAALFAVAWFLVLLLLPHGDADPSALLPGAVLVGVSLALLQWFVQLYLPGRISRASELYGAIGVTVATLGWFFIVGRLFVASLVLNATLWERFGSLSEFVFGLPGLRRVPKRWPVVARFFGLDPPSPDHEVQPAPSDPPDLASPEVDPADRPGFRPRG